MIILKSPLFISLFFFSSLSNVDVHASSVRIDRRIIQNLPTLCCTISHLSAFCKFKSKSSFRTGKHHIKEGDLLTYKDKELDRKENKANRYYITSPHSQFRALRALS
jgi:hypothetical protein